MEQQADTASQALRRYQDEIEGLKQEVEKCEGKVKRRKARIATLSRQCAPLEGLEKKRKKAVSDRKRLGLKPNPEVYYLLEDTREVPRAWGLNWLLGPKKESIPLEERERTDYSRVEQWERQHAAANKKISGLDKKITPLKKKRAERQKIQGELPKLKRETGKALRKLKRAEDRLAREQKKYYEASRETRRAQLRGGMRRELENIFDALPRHLDGKLTRCWRGFRGSSVLASKRPLIPHLGDESAGNLSESFRKRAIKVRDEEFVVVVVGEMNRGKSMLLNAMMHKQLLAMEVRECTATVNFLRYPKPGESADNVVVHFTDGRPPEACG